MELSKRLKAITGMVTQGNRVADVGCDHGFVSIYLYKEGISPKVYAMDVRSGPLLRAKEHIEAYGLSAYIETRLSDGVQALSKGEADTLICAGMGGRLMTKILSEGADKIALMKELVLQPQSELCFFRRYLRENGFLIVQENMIEEDGKYYPMMRVLPSEVAEKLRLEGMQSAKSVFTGERTGKSTETEAWQRREDTFGPYLLKEKHPVLKEYLELLRDRTKEILAGLKEKNAEARVKELQLEMEDIEACLSLYE